jgi:hypothetical protein
VSEVLRTACLRTTAHLAKVPETEALAVRGELRSVNGHPPTPFRQDCDTRRTERFSIEGIDNITSLRCPGRDLLMSGQFDCRDVHLDDWSVEVYIIEFAA